MPRPWQEKAEAFGINGRFLVIAMLFFAWGFIAANNDPLIAALRVIFNLDYLHGLTTQLVFFAAFGLVSLPAAAISARLGSGRALLLALSIMGVGSLLVFAAIQKEVFASVLAALFIMATGLTALQVTANPLAANAGPAASSHFRLTLAQALNAIGVVVGSRFGAWEILSRKLSRHHATVALSTGNASTLRDNVGEAFLVIAAMIAMLGVAVWMQRHRLMAKLVDVAPAPSGVTILAAFRSRWAIAGAAAIGLYVGAEVSIGSIMIAFLHLPGIMNVSLEHGGRLLATFYWGGAMIGRVMGSILLTRVPAARLLAGCAMAAATLCVVACFAGGETAGCAALSVGLCNAIMFPTIFTLTLERSTARAEATSGLLCQAIAGGALVPIFVGSIADHYGLPNAFLVPACAYIAVLAFSLCFLLTRFTGQNRIVPAPTTLSEERPVNAGRPTY